MPYLKSKKIKKRQVENKHKSFAEIAEHLGVSSSTAHRMHDELIIKIRTALARDPYIQEWLIERKDDIEWIHVGNEFTD